MPVHLYWGDDEAARTRAVEALVERLVDPAWAQVNLSRLDGSDAGQAGQALEEARTPPFGAGARVVLLQRSPFCAACPADLASRLEASLDLIPPDGHLVLVSPGKPDARLRTTKALRAVADEKSFVLPAVWDGEGLLDLVQRTAGELGLRLEPAAAEALSEAIDTCSPVASSMSISRLGGSAVIARASPVSSSVVWPMAETTITSSCPSSRQAAIRRATVWMRSTSATEVPPNF